MTIFQIHCLKNPAFHAKLTANSDTPRGLSGMNEKLIFAQLPSAEAPIALHLAGETMPDPSYRILRNCANYWVLEAVAEGNGTLLVDDKKFHVQPGDCYLLPAGSRHFYYSDPANPWKKYWFNFSGTLIPDILRSYRINGQVLFRNYDLCQEFSRAVKELSCTPLEMRQHRFAGILMELLSRIAHISHLAESEDTKISAEGKILRQLLLEYFNAPPPPLALLAKKINRSESQMLRIFRRDFGTSPVAFLYEKKLEMAMNLLRNTDLPIKNIAAKLGFTDEFYFSRVFRKKCGKSPREYRQKTE